MASYPWFLDSLALCNAIAQEPPEGSEAAADTGGEAP